MKFLNKNRYFSALVKNFVYLKQGRVLDEAIGSSNDVEIHLTMPFFVLCPKELCFIFKAYRNYTHPAPWHLSNVKQNYFSL